MTSQTKRLMGEGTRQAMEYEEELVHNLLTAAQTAVVSIVKKVKDNILCIITAPVIMLPSTLPQTPAAKLPHTLLRVPKTLVIK